MIEVLFSILVKAAGIYLLVGFIVAVLFLSRWLKGVDPSSVGGSRGFKVLVTPGVIVLWPVILRMVFGQKSGMDADGAEALRRIHRVAIVLLAIAGVALFITAFVWRAPGLQDLPPVQNVQP